MGIQSSVISEYQLTIHTAQGELQFNEVVTTLSAFFANEPTTNVLWDLREAVLTRLTGDQIRIFVEFAAQRNVTRQGGRTALLVSERVGDYSMVRMVEILGNMLGPNVEGVIFHDYEEAMQWLRQE